MNDFEQKKRAILERADLLEVISEHVAMKRRGQRWVGLCPFHNEKTPSFTLRPEHGTFKCFGCGRGGDVFTFVQLRENLSFIEAMRLLADRAGIDLGRLNSGPSMSGGVGRADLAKINAWAADFFRRQLLDDRLGRPAREYLTGRGVSPETAERFGLGLAVEGGADLRRAAAKAGFEDRVLVEADLLRLGERGDHYETFRNRLMFPIRDATARVVGFGGRTLVDDRAKYLNTRQTSLFDKGRGLYGIDLARHAIVERGRTVVVEGYMDCIAAHQAGCPEAVATLGTALTDAQIELLRRYCEEVILLFDSDEAGVAASDRAIRVALPRCVGVRLARIPNSKDPSEFLAQAGPDEFSDVLNRAVGALEFKWLKTQEEFQTGTSNSRRREAVLGFLQVVGEAFAAHALDPIQRGLMVNQIAHLLRMDRGEVDRLMVRSQQRGRAAGEAAGGVVAGSRRAVPADAEQAAWVAFLEVALNEPGLLATDGDRPSPTRIADERDRRIAAAVYRLAEQMGEFRLGDVLAMFQDPADVERVMELAQRGADRGNFERTLQTALERLHRAADVAAVRLGSPGEGGDGNDGRAGSVAALADASKRMQEHRGYAPRRLIRRATHGVG